MKILFIAAWYPNKNHPTAGTFVKEHAKAVSKIGDEVIILYCEKGRSPLKGPYAVLETIEDSIHTIRISYYPTTFRTINYLVYLGSILNVSWKLIRFGFKPEIIHAHIYEAGVPAALVSKIFRIPLVVTEHSTEFPRKKLKGLKVLQAKFAYKWAKVILPVSISLQRAIQEYGIKASFKVVPNVVDNSIFYFSPFARKKSQLKHLLVVSLLDISHKKGIPHLLSALGQLRQSREDWCLDIIGDGPVRAEYERLTLSLGIDDKVTFHGVKSKKEVADFMQRADIFVLPSLWENSPCVLLEAMASGLPIVATRTGGIPEFIDQEIGVLVPPGDSDKLAEALLRMIESLPKYDRAVIAKKADKYRPEAVGRLIHSVYESCVSK